MMEPTIYEAMRAKLGREPTDAELSAECRRIICEAHAEIARRQRGEYRLIKVHKPDRFVYGPGDLQPVEE